jgi:ParB/RepB/Spo0J family partition protein
MELEFSQLDRRYEGLRVSSRARDEEVLSSIARVGQQNPVIVVVGEEHDREIVVDGFKRIRALIRLERDTVQATRWEVSEPEALLISRTIRSSKDSPIEEGWLLRELRDRFDLSIEEIGRRLGRSASWVSNRLGLVNDLPESIQDQVRKGEIVPHAAMRYFLPLSRADLEGAVALASAIGRLRPTTRQTEALCVAFARGSDKARAFVLEHPELVLRAREDASSPPLPAEIPSAQLRKDLLAIAGIARRASGRAGEGALRSLTPPEIEELGRAVARARTDTEHLFLLLKEEITNARRKDESHGSRAPRKRSRQARHCSGAEDIAEVGQRDHQVGEQGGPEAHPAGESGGAPR